MTDLTAELAKYDRREGVKWHAFAHVDKYTPEQVAELTAFLGYEPKAADFKRMSTTPNDMAEADGNILVTTGLGNLTNLFIAGGGQGFTAAKAIIGVGATATAAALADTHLGADGGSAWYQGADSAPTRTTVTTTNDTVSAVATFASGNANFAWAEWGWAAATSGTVTGNATLASVATTPIFLNHKIASLGTKVSGAVWVFTTTVTFS